MRASGAMASTLCTSLADSGERYSPPLQRRRACRSGAAANDASAFAGAAMSTRAQPSAVITVAARESILIDCRWTDAAWTLKPTNVLEQACPERIRWDFELPSGRRFTDPAFTRLLETSRAFIALIRLRSISTGLALRASTAAGYFD